MELASTLTLGPCSEYRRLQIGAENSSFRNAIGTIGALEALRDALYKSTTTTTAIATIYYLQGRIPEFSNGGSHIPFLSPSLSLCTVPCTFFFRISATYTS